ncbi:MAG: ADP-ribosylglycohydrolase family protein [Planctomycetaceae bacterium]|nr:ADP-ribosylglycohydrolase family protein [Planctomycetaceae bacterium]
MNSFEMHPVTYAGLAGLLVGTAIGDAIGLPREGLSRRRAMRLFGPAPLEHRLLFGRGMFSDDTEHACMTAQALLAHSDNPAKFARSLAWRLRGWFLSLPPGIGMGTAKACMKLLSGWPANRSGVCSAGNGPAMRAPIIGAVLADRPDLMREMARASTRLTHTDSRAEEGAYVIAAAAAHAAAGEIDAENFFEQVLPQIQGQQLKQYLAAARQQLAAGASPAEFATEMGMGIGISGYINHTVPAAIFCWLRYRGDFRRSVEEAVLLGGDSDTVGAIVGALAGASAGLEGIPAQWIKGLFEWPRTVDWIKNLARQLAEGKAANAPRLFWPGVLLRNMLLLMIVLAHGLRRLLPPY